jgi:hypothetical protein
MRGRTRLCSWAFVAAVITSPIEIAAAQTSLQSFRVGSWNGGAFARDGRFTHCAAWATYASGVSVRFAIDRQYRWGMDWTIVTGSSAPVASTSWRFPSMAQTRFA